MPGNVSLLYCERSAAPSHGARPPRRGDRLTQLARRPATIDRHDMSGNVRGSVRAEKDYDLRDLLRLAPRTERTYAPALSISPITALAPKGHGGRAPDPGCAARNNDDLISREIRPKLTRRIRVGKAERSMTGQRGNDRIELGTALAAQKSPNSGGNDVAEQRRRADPHSDI